MAQQDYYPIKYEDVLFTEGGLKARVISTDARIGGGDYDIVVLIREDDGNDFIEWYKSADIDYELGTLPCDSNSERSLHLNLMLAA